MNLNSRNKVNIAFNSASMADLVFLLLIFFMLTSTLINPYALDLLLPKSSAQTTAKPNVTISIDKNYTYFVNKEEVAAENLEYQIKKNMRSATEEQPTIILNVEKTVPIDKAVYVMDIANRNRFRLVLATSPK